MSCISWKKSSRSSSLDGSALKHTTGCIMIMDLCSMLVHTDSAEGVCIYIERDSLNSSLNTMHCKVAKLLQTCSTSYTLLLCYLATLIISWHPPHLQICCPLYIPLIVLAATDCVLLLLPSSTVIVPLKIVMCAFSDRTFFSFMRSRGTSHCGPISVGNLTVGT